MYRARVQAVSDSKVFADGKWLRCIGNKPVSVGERVWTDGRVVYGHYTIPQTPLISIPQDETVIPIISMFNYYTFRKGKLIPLFKDGENIPNENYVANNMKKIVNHPGFPCFAVNIDKSGNIFALTTDGDNVQIRVNGRTVKSIYYGYLLDEIIGICPSTHAQTNGYEADLDINWGFIENENNWAFTVVSGCTKPNAISISDSAATIHFFSNTGSILIDKQLGHVSAKEWTAESSFVEGFTSDYFISPGRSSARFPLHNDYYYSAPSGDALLTWSGGYFATYNKSTQTETRKIFTPNGNMIFEGAFRRSAYIALTKTPYGYLMGVDGIPWKWSLTKDDVYQGDSINKYYPNYSHNQLWVGAGLYLLNNGQATQLLNTVILNQNLQPMKNKKNWQNRIETISFDD